MPVDERLLKKSYIGAVHHLKKIYKELGIPEQDSEELARGGINLLISFSGDLTKPGYVMLEKIFDIVNDTESAVGVFKDSIILKLVKTLFSKTPLEKLLKDKKEDKHQKT